MILDMFKSGSAEFSECLRYRYSLTRRWGDGPRMAFIMLNPSTANSVEDDPTIRRCIGFARREGCGSLIVENLYPFRATKPADLWAQPPNIRIGGPDGEIATARLFRENNGPIVAAWGADTRRAEHWIVERYRSQLQCLGKTQDGHPRHPLYVKGDQPLVPL